MKSERSHLPEKTELRIHDYVDVGVPLLERMFQKRLRGYRAMGHLTEIKPPVEKRSGPSRERHPQVG